MRLLVLIVVFCIVGAGCGDEAPDPGAVDAGVVEMSDSGVVDAGAQDAAVADAAVVGVVVAPLGERVTSEAGTTASFSLALTLPPAAPVLIALAVRPVVEGTLDTSTVTFTAADWDQPQTVTITGAHDGVPDGDRTYQLEVLPAQSRDARYDGLDGPDFMLTNVDDGTAESCLTQLRYAPTSTSAAYRLDVDRAGPLPPFVTRCDMTGDGGGWTLVLETDATSAAHETAGPVALESLARLARVGVAKVDDAAVRALLAQTSTRAEIRAESPILSTKLFTQGTGWSVPRPATYPSAVLAKLAEVAPYALGFQCYDGDVTTDPPCSTNHWCFGLVGAEHVCIRRFDGAGLWFDFGLFTPGYYAASIWVR